MSTANCVCMFQNPLATSEQPQRLSLSVHPHVSIVNDIKYLRKTSVVVNLRDPAVVRAHAGNKQKLKSSEEGRGSLKRKILKYAIKELYSIKN